MANTDKCDGKTSIEMWGYKDFDKALRSCLGNRPLNKKRVQRFLRMMFGGTFDGANADPFLFYGDGADEHMFEGVHRCMAGRIFCDTTGSSVRVRVTRGLNKNCYKHMGGGNQSISDQLVRFRKQPNAKRMAGIASSIALFFSRDSNIGSVDEYDAWCSVCHRGVRYITDKILTKKNLCFGPIMAAFAIAYEVEPEAVERIISALIGETDLAAKSPARALDDYFKNRDSINLNQDRLMVGRRIFAAVHAEAHGKIIDIGRLRESAPTTDYFLNAFAKNKNLNALLQVRRSVQALPVEMSLVPEGSPVGP